MPDSRVFKWAGGILVASVVIAIVVVLVVILVQRSNNNNDSSDTTGSRVTDSLKFLVVISRHGNRGASVDYPNDPYPLDNPEYWPYGVDRLTPRGRNEMYNLGVRVRALYNGFINSTFNPEELHASSTYKDRMLISGEAFLAGLYPPKGWQVFEASLPWQPTPLYSDSPDKTIVISECPKFLTDYAALRSDFIDTYTANITSLVSTFENLTNTLSTDGLTSLWDFWDKAISEDTEGYTLPDWAKELYPYPLQYLISKQYIASYAGSEEVIRIVVGELYDEIVGVLESVVNGTLTERKVQYYSGHDTSIVSLQGLMDVPSDSFVGMVKPGSGLALELHQNQNTSQYYLEVVYIDSGTTDLDITILKPSACGDPCDFDTLLNNTAQYMGTSFEELCNS